MRRRYEVSCIDFYLSNVKFVNLNLLLEQWQQLYVGKQMADIGNSIFDLRKRVVGLNNLHIIQPKIQRKFEVYVTYGNFKARFFRSIFGHMLYSPILNGREVKQ